MLSFHLLQNVMLADWAPPLLVLGLTPAMAAVAERVAGRAADHHAPASPSPTGWPSGTSSTSPASTATRSTTAGRWASSTCCSSPPASPSGGRRSCPAACATAPRVIYLAAAFFLAAPVALLIALANSTIYPYYDTTPHLWGLSPLEDQSLGGMLMAVEQSMILFVAAILGVRGDDGRGRGRFSLVNTRARSLRPVLSPDRTSPRTSSGWRRWSRGPPPAAPSSCCCPRSGTPSRTAPSWRATPSGWTAARRSTRWPAGRASTGST